MIIDFHTHCFPDHLAPKAIPPMAEKADITALTDGTFGGLCENQRNSHIDKFVIMHIATKAKSVKNTNDFAVSLQSEDIYCYGTVFPGSDEDLSDLDYISENMYGLKLHPDYQDFFAADEKYFPIYEKCSRLKLPVLFHAGYDPISPQVRHCPVSAIKLISEEFPSLKIISAHMGGMQYAAEAEKVLVGLENVYFDTSMSHYYVPQEDFTRMILSHGADKILFATDSPWSSAENELRLLENAHLGGEDMDMILYKNAQYLLKREF